MKIIKSPTSVTLPRKTKADRVVQLNLNTYRNLHYRTNNDVKKLYCDMVKSQLEGVKLTPPISVTFELYRKGKRLVDKNNVYSIVAKFLYDALVHYEVIPDDNDNYIKTEIYLPTRYEQEENYCYVGIKDSG